MNDTLQRAKEYLQENRSQKNDLIEDLVKEVQHWKDFANAPKGYAEISRIEVGGPIEIGRTSMVISYSESEHFIHAALWDHDAGHEICWLSHDLSGIIPRR